MSQTVERPPVGEGREAGQGATEPLPAALRASGRSAAVEYLPFDNVEARNGLQALVEIPLMIRALRPPHGARLLEIGCGSGVALPVLDDRLSPVELVGLDIDRALLAHAGQRLRNTATEAALVEGDVRSPVALLRADAAVVVGAVARARPERGVVGREAKSWRVATGRQPVDPRHGVRVCRRRKYALSRSPRDGMFSLHWLDEPDW